jgi:hypothetical protein
MFMRVTHKIDARPDMNVVQTEFQLGGRGDDKEIS